MMSAGEPKVTGSADRCPERMAFQPREGARHPYEPEFCIEVQEVSQEEDNEFWAELARREGKPHIELWELLIRLIDGRTEKKNAKSEARIRKIAAARIRDSSVLGIDIVPVMFAQIPRPKGKIAGPRKPAVLRTRGEARMYCKWKYPDGGNLPNGRQWENACGRGNYCTASGELKHSEARFGGSREEGPADVDRYPVNARGTRNMTGNVREWTLDTNRYDNAIVRGGAWLDIDSIVHALYHDETLHDRRSPFVGWRCVMNFE